MGTTINFWDGYNSYLYGNMRQKKRNIERQPEWMEKKKKEKRQTRYPPGSNPPGVESGVQGP